MLEKVTYATISEHHLENFEFSEEIILLHCFLVF